MSELRTKKCCGCKEILPVTSFYPRNSKTKSYPSTEFTALCKKCDKIRLLKNKDRNNLLRKERRHKKGISKRYRGQYAPYGKRTVKEYKKYNYTEYREKNKEKIRTYRKAYKYNKKAAGKLTAKTIQLVYEDNIKRYGTLTCYLCLKPLEMQKEHLEHKQPLSRGGSNEYENLGISCSRCNCKKHNKTVTEYLEYLNKKHKEKK